MTAPTNFPAAVAPIGSQLAAGAILTRARRLFSFQIAADRLPGGDQAATLGFLPHRSPPQFSRSSKHQPTHNIRGCSSERNEVGVVRDTDLRADRADRLPEARSVLRLFLEAPGRTLVGHRYTSPSPSPLVAELCVSQTHSGTDGERSDGELDRNHESFDRKCGE
jgi:hypothetical protein